MQSYITVPAILTLVVLYGLMILSTVRMLRVRQDEEPGWTALTPGPPHWFGLIGSWLAVGLMSWVWIFVGSARRDAAQQMQIAFGLILAFGFCSVFSAHFMASIKRMNLRWRGAMLVFNGPAGPQKLDMGDAMAFRRDLSGSYRFTFEGGEVVKVDPFAKGSDAFFAKIFAVINKKTNRT